MPLAAHCHSLRPDKTSGWLAFFELGEKGPRAGQFLVVGPELVDRAEDVQAALRAGQAAVRYLKDVPGHAPPVTLLEATSRILLHESAKTQTSLEFGCAVLEEEALWFMSRGDVRLVPLGDDAHHALASERPHAVSVSPGDRFFLGRLPGGGEDLDPDVRRRLEHAGGGDGGLILQMVKREDIPNVPGRRPAAPKRDDRQLEFETVIHELQLEFPKTGTSRPESAPDHPAPLRPPAGETPPEAPPEAEAVPEAEPEPGPEAASWEESWAGPEPEAGPPSTPEPEPETGPEPESEPESEPAAEPEPEPAALFAEPAAPDPAPEPERVEAHAYEPGGDQAPADAPPFPDETVPVPGGLLSPGEEPSPAFAPEETRGLGFWISIVAAGVALGALAGYLFLVRPQMHRTGTRSSGGVEPVVKASVVPDSLPRSIADERVWEDQFTQAVTSTPLVAEEKVIFGCRDGRVYALSRSDGRRIWAYAAADGFGSSPARAGEMVVIGGYDGRLYALDIHSGEERWTVQTKGRIVASPAVEEGTVFVGSYDHNLYAVSARDGRVLWARDLESVLWSSPVCDDGTVWVAGLDGRLTALDAKGGRVLWQVETGAPIYSTPAVGKDKVFVGSQDGFLYAFERAGGKRVWKTSGGSGEVNGSPALNEDVVVIGTDAGTILGVDAESGSVLWKTTTGGQVKSRPAFLGALVWVTGYDGLLHGIDWRSGNEMTAIRTESSAYSSPVIDEDVAFFGALDGRFFAIRLRS